MGDVFGVSAFSAVTYETMMQGAIPGVSVFLQRGSTGIRVIEARCAGVS